MGGKVRQSKAIEAALLGQLKGTRARIETYVEPFCGGLGAAERAIPALAALGVREFVLADASPALIVMWQAVLGGWHPPDTMSKDAYDTLKKAMDITDPLTGYCGFALSFGGGWFGGYARAPKVGTDEWQRARKRATLRKIDRIRPFNPKFVCTNYDKIEDHLNTPFGAGDKLLYLDPPYANRGHQYNAPAGFDHEAFWKWAEKVGSTERVIVTEFTAPSHWKPIHCFGNTITKHWFEATRPPAMEHIYTL